jgi:hypothetical protein
MLVLELGPGQLDWRKLARCQREASSGIYAQVMSGFIRWLADRYDGLGERLKKEQAALRERAGANLQHRRTPGIVADLALGLRHFLLFAHDASAISTEEAEKFWERSWRALGGAAAAQPQHQAANEPARRFRELLSAAIASGRAHVANPRGDTPVTPEAWGWRLSGDEWRPQGERVGWLEGGDLYLEPEAAYAAVQKQGRDSGESLTVTGRTLRKRLHERGLLLSVDEAREVLTVRRTLGGSRRDVLHTSGELLSMHSEEPDRPDRWGQKQHKPGQLAPPLWSGFDLRTRPEPDHEPDRQRDGRVAAERRSGLGCEPAQHNTSISGEDPGNGRVGRFAVGETERESGVGHARSGRRVGGRV